MSILELIWVGWQSETSCRACKLIREQEKENDLALSFLMYFLLYMWNQQENLNIFKTLIKTFVPFIIAMGENTTSSLVSTSPTALHRMSLF